MGPGGGAAVIDDLHELRAAASSSVGDDVPVVLFGHSMGSIIALAYLTRHATGLAGGILCGMPVSVDDATSLAELFDGLADEDMRDQPATDLLGSNNAPFEPARTPYDWLSRDPAEVDRYLTDPLCGDSNPLTYGYLNDLFNATAPALDATRRDLVSRPRDRGRPRPRRGHGRPCNHRFQRPREGGGSRRLHALRGRSPRTPQRNQP